MDVDVSPEAYYKALKPFDIWSHRNNGSPIEDEEPDAITTKADYSTASSLTPGAPVTTTPSTVIEHATGRAPTEQLQAQTPSTVNLVVPDGMFFVKNPPKTKEELRRARMNMRWVNAKDWMLQLVLFIVASLILTGIVAYLTHPDMSLLDWLREFGFVQ